MAKWMFFRIIKPKVDVVKTEQELVMKIVHADDACV